MTFHNDLGRPVTLGLCDESAPGCRQLTWRIGVDPGARTTQEIRSDGKAVRRFLVVGPPETVYGCLAFRFEGRQPERQVELSRARDCGSGR